MQATVANQDPQATFYVPLKEHIRTVRCVTLIEARSQGKIIEPY